MMPGKPFSLFKRNRFYYCRFKQADGSWSTAHSTKETSKGHAEAWAIEYLQSGNLLIRNNATFKEFSQDFFNWNGEWATDKKVSGKRISQRHCIERNEVLKNHVLSVFGPVKLHNIDRAMIKAFKNELYRNGRSGSLINKCMCILRAILETAEERNLIKAVPKIERATENPKSKGILTLDEVNAIFNVQWDDFRGYIGNLLAAATGLRLGELQALTLSDVHLDKGYIIVRRSWEKRLGVLNETTKTGRTRTIFIPDKVKYEIQRLISVHPNPIPDAFLFFGEIKQSQPADQKYFVRTLYHALRKIGIDENERQRRNISFHSWRHWFNSLLINAKIPIQKIQSLTGHRTNEMSEHYYHLDDMSDVRQIQERIFTTLEYRGSGENKIIN